jgi:nicotinamide phosphoribosyltransferase
MSDYTPTVNESGFRINPLFATDFYKTGHLRQYPDKTEFVYSNLTCRSDKLAVMLPDFDHRVVNVGLQGVCDWLFRDLWNKEVFQRPKDDVVGEYQACMDKALGAGAVDTKHIAALHDLGYLPILIKALPEGARVNLRVPLCTIQNTHPDFYWVTNYVETQLSAALWQTFTSATTAYEYKRLLTYYATLTGSPLAFVPWQAHDFSARGMGVHSGAMSGFGHLTSFTGTDTVHAIDYARQHYDGDSTFIGGSVPATEHSVMCMGGKDDEIGTFRRLINDIYPSGIVSIVSDTWDFFKVLTEYAAALKPEILARKPDALGFAKVVFRPDSGDPVKIIVGDRDAPIGSPEYKGAVECLWDVFGGTVTETGYKVLDQHVGLIYGDSITLARAHRILEALAIKGFASCNIVFGVGSFTYQYVTRDTFGSAVKATFGVVDGEDRMLYKDPKTDDGMKKSAKGLLRVEQDDAGNFVLHDQQSRYGEATGLLRPVFRDSKVLSRETLAGIRERLETGKLQ